MRVSFAQIVFDTLLLTGITLSAQLTINIPPSQQLPNPSVLPASTHATLQSVGPPISTQLTRTSKFSFDDVPSGSYLLNVHCRDYFFEPLRIDVVKNETAPSREYVTAWQTFRGNEWDNKGEVRGQGDGSGEVKVDVRCIGGKDYYQQRQGCTFIHLLGYEDHQTNDVDNSLDSVIPQEPNDPHGTLLAWAYRWHAVPHGEHGSRIPRRV